MLSASEPEPFPKVRSLTPLSDCSASSSPSTLTPLSKPRPAPFVILIVFSESSEFT